MKSWLALFIHEDTNYETENIFTCLKELLLCGEAGKAGGIEICLERAPLAFCLSIRVFKSTVTSEHLITES